MCTEVPEHSRRPFIVSGYRPPQNETTSLPTTVLRELSYFHNETGNMVTHVFGLGIIVTIAINYFLSAGLQSTFLDKVVMGLYFGSVSYCFAASVCFHALCSHPYQTYCKALTCDMLGIVACILGSFYSGLWLGFRCHSRIAYIYMGIISILSIPLLTIIAVPKYRERLYLIAPIFSLVVASGLIPTFQFYQMMRDDSHDRVLSNYVMVFTVMGMFTCYLIGLIFYMSRFPERLFPGRFDFIFNSHQAWHVMIILAIILQYSGQHFLMVRNSKGLDLCKLAGQQLAMRA